MNNWITNRMPTADDAPQQLNWLVWVCHKGRSIMWSYDGVKEGQPWMPITPPDPYVKPKRYVAENVGIGRYWRVRDTKNGELCNIAVADEATIRKLEDFLNEVMP